MSASGCCPGLFRCQLLSFLLLPCLVHALGILSLPVPAPSPRWWHSCEFTRITGGRFGLSPSLYSASPSILAQGSAALWGAVSSGSQTQRPSRQPAAFPSKTCTWSFSPPAKALDGKLPQFSFCLCYWRWLLCLALLACGMKRRTVCVTSLACPTPVTNPKALQPGTRSGGGSEARILMGLVVTCNVGCVFNFPGYLSLSP